MDEDTIKTVGRRKVIALLGSVGVGAAVIRSVISDDGSAPATGNLTNLPGTARDPTFVERIHERGTDDQSGEEIVAEESGLFDVSDFGAALDGTTDDTAATLHDFEDALEGGVHLGSVDGVAVATQCLLGGDQQRPPVAVENEYRVEAVDLRRVFADLLEHRLGVQ